MIGNENKERLTKFWPISGAIMALFSGLCPPLLSPFSPFQPKFPTAGIQSLLPPPTHLCLRGNRAPMLPRPPKKESPRLASKSLPAMPLVQPSRASWRTRGLQASAVPHGCAPAAIQSREISLGWLHFRFSFHASCNCVWYLGQTLF